jgi:hypothetical protein
MNKYFVAESYELRKYDRDTCLEKAVPSTH